MGKSRREFMENGILVSMPIVTMQRSFIWSILTSWFWRAVSMSCEKKPAIVIVSRVLRMYAVCLRIPNWMLLVWRLPITGIRLIGPVDKAEYTVGPWLKFDGEAEHFVGEHSVEANRLLKDPRRAEFDIPSPKSV
jgi:hypothetical protein